MHDRAMVVTKNSNFQHFSPSTGYTCYTAVIPGDDAGVIVLSNTQIQFPPVSRKTGGDRETAGQAPGGTRQGAAAAENRPLTAIRGFAALWVVAFHLNTSWPFPGGPHFQAVLGMGHVAVDIFFVLSGFILTIVYRDLVGPGSGRFALRRICRIYPLHLCIMAVLGLVGLYMQLKHGEAHPWATYWPAVILVQPFLGFETDWNVPSWSLGVEFACYAVFPFANRVLRSIKIPGLIGGIVLAAAIEATVLHYYADIAAGPGAVLRAFAGFFLGCTLARLFLLETATFARHSVVLQVVGLITFAFAVFFESSIGAALAASVLIVAIASPAGPLVHLLSMRACVWLGQISFSIYLLHIPLLSTFEKFAPIRTAVSTPSLRFAVAGVFLAVLLVLSGTTYHLIERPFRHLPRLIDRWFAAAALRPRYAMKA